ncbi:MAG: ABC transporter ATP-binding protein [Gammaproteobacteria bacterium]|nr:ABC transporter ATP-binding protein [Gammaproteobacteria bacterium]
MPPLLSVDNLVKAFPGVRAVDGISFSVREGQCFGLLGPNGAGKTTTLEILEGITDPDGGEILFRGAPRDTHFRELIGIQFQHTALQDFQTVEESLQLFASFYSRHRPRQELIELCNLGELLTRDTRKLSGGQRQRLLLAIALVNDPDLVFLDEPTTGLDPQSRRNFWQLIDGIKAAGKTVLLTTHYMEEASVLCDEIAVIDRGRIIDQGVPERLLAAHFPRALVRVPLAALPDASDLLPGFEVRGSHATAATDDIDQTLAVLNEHAVALDELHVSAPTLDDLFLKLTGHGLRES